MLPKTKAIPIVLSESEHVIYGVPLCGWSAALLLGFQMGPKGVDTTCAPGHGWSLLERIGFSVNPRHGHCP